MWTALSKYKLSSVLIGCLLVSMLCNGYLAEELQDCRQSCTEYELINTKYQSQIMEAEKHIEHINAEVNKYKLNLEQFTNNIQAKELELAEARAIACERVNQELQQDSSCEKQLEILNRILHDFTKR